MTSNVLTWGEVMLRLSSPNNQRFSQSESFEACYGGSEANVAASLAKLGIPSSFVTRVPKNDLGEAALSTFNYYGVDTSASSIGGDRLGLYYLEKGVSSRPGKVIYDRDLSSFATIQPGMINWKKVFKNIQWFHWSGITPALNKTMPAVCLEALKVATEMGITISCDLNYRANLWKYNKKANEVLPELLQYVDVLFGGKGDSELMLNIKIKEKDAHEKVFALWQKEFPRIKTIASTGRTEANASKCNWQGFIWQDKRLYTSTQYHISHIVDRVGAGDAYSAGIIYGLLKNKNDLQKVVEFATAASCLKYSIVGDVNLATVNEVEQLMLGNAGDRIAR